MVIVVVVVVEVVVVVIVRWVGEGEGVVLVLLALVHGKRSARRLLMQDYWEMLFIRIPNALSQFSAGHLLDFAAWGGPVCLAKVDVIIVVAVVVIVVVVVAGTDDDVVVDTNP